MNFSYRKYLNYIIYNIFDLIYTILPALIICTPLVLFNQYIQLNYPPILDNPYNLNNWNFIEPIYRTFAHKNPDHFISNLVSTTIYSLMIGILYKLRFVLFSYLLLIIQSSLIVKYYINGVGISIFTYGLFGIISITIFIVILNQIHYLIKNIGSENNIKKIIFAIILFSIGLFLMNSQIILEIMYIYNIPYLDTVFSIPYINDFTKISGFNKYSSMSHIAGYITGLVIGSVAYVVSKYLGYKQYRDNFI